VTIPSRQDLDRNSRGAQHQREGTGHFVVGFGGLAGSAFFEVPPLIIPPQPSTLLRSFGGVLGLFLSFSISPSATYPGSFPPLDKNIFGIFRLETPSRRESFTALLRFFAGVLAGPNDNYPRLFLPTGVRQAEPSISVMGEAFPARTSPPGTPERTWWSPSNGGEGE